MRFADPQISRRGAFLFVALFSCLQITLGFFLINGNGHDSVLSKGIENQAYYAQTEFYDEGSPYLNAIEPAADKISDNNNKIDQEEQDIITQKLIESISTLSTVDYGEQ